MDNSTDTLVRQALLSGAIVGIILFTIVLAIWLTYVMSGAAVNPFMASLPPATATAPAAAAVGTPAAATPLPPTATRPAPATAVPTVTPVIPTHTRAPVATATPTATTECPRPATWLPYLVQPGDNFLSLSIRFLANEAQIREGNCMADDAPLVPGTYVNLPGTVQTPTPTLCARPPDWLPYILQPGDQLDQLALYYGVTAATILANSCLPPGYTPAVGDTIYLPPYSIVPTPAYNSWSTPSYYYTATPYPWYTPAPRPTQPAPRTPTPWPTHTYPTPTAYIPAISTPTPGGAPPTHTVPTPFPTQPPAPTPAPTQAPIPTVIRPTQVPPTPVPPRPTPVPPQPTIPPISTPTRALP